MPPPPGQVRPERWDSAATPAFWKGRFRCCSLPSSFHRSFHPSSFSPHSAERTLENLDINIHGLLALTSVSAQDPDLRETVPTFAYFRREAISSISEGLVGSEASRVSDAARLPAVEANRVSAGFFSAPAPRCVALGKVSESSPCSSR